MLLSAATLPKNTPPLLSSHQSEWFGSPSSSAKTAQRTHSEALIALGVLGVVASAVLFFTVNPWALFVAVPSTGLAIKGFFEEKRAIEKEIESLEKEREGILSSLPSNKEELEEQLKEITTQIIELQNRIVQNSGETQQNLLDQLQTLTQEKNREEGELNLERRRIISKELSRLKKRLAIVDPWGLSPKNPGS